MTTPPIPASLPATPPARRRCDADARRGTGTGVCDSPLDARGQRPAASQHLRKLPCVEWNVHPPHPHEFLGETRQCEGVSRRDVQSWQARTAAVNAATRALAPYVVGPHDDVALGARRAAELAVNAALDLLLAVDGGRDPRDRIVMALTDLFTHDELAGLCTESTPATADAHRRLRRLIARAAGASSPAGARP